MSDVCIAEDVNCASSVVNIETCIFFRIPAVTKASVRRSVQSIRFIFFELDVYNTAASFCINLPDGFVINSILLIASAGVLFRYAVNWPPVR